MDRDLSIQPNAVREPEWERVVRLVPKWQRTIDSSKIIGELPVGTVQSDPLLLREDGRPSQGFWLQLLPGGDHSQITIDQNPEP